MKEKRNQPQKDSIRSFMPAGRAEELDSWVKVPHQPLIKRLVEFLTPQWYQEKQHSQGMANYVRSLGGKTLAVRMTEDRLRRKNLSETLKYIGDRARIYEPRWRGVTYMTVENLFSEPFYSLGVTWLTSSKRPPFIGIEGIELISVSIGHQPSMDMDPDLLPGNNWSAGLERGSVGNYINCSIYEAGIDGLTRRAIDNFAQKHDISPNSIYFHEEF